MPQLTPLSYHEIIDACALPGCPFCRLSHRTVQRHLDRVLYDSVNDPPTRARLRDSFGYCYQHAWQLANRGEATALGVAFIYQDMLNAVTRLLRQGEYQEPGRGLLSQVRERVQRAQPAQATSGMVQKLTPDGTCPACTERDKMDKLTLANFMDALAEADQRMEAAFAGSAGICVPHLRAALALGRSETAVATLQKITLEKLQALHAEVTEFIRKNDYRYQEERFGEEADSWRRAVSMLVGTAVPE